MIDSSVEMGNFEMQNDESCCKVSDDFNFSVPEMGLGDGKIDMNVHYTSKHSGKKKESACFSPAEKYNKIHDNDDLLERL